MTSEIHSTISVCEDCLFLHANGEIGADRPSDLPEPLSLITAPYTVTMGMANGEHADTCTVDDRSTGECDCENLGFRTTRCEGCGDWHHGDRYTMTLWRD